MIPDLYRFTLHLILEAFFYNFCNSFYLFIQTHFFYIFIFYRTCIDSSIFLLLSKYIKSY